MKKAIPLLAVLGKERETGNRTEKKKTRGKHSTLARRRHTTSVYSNGREPKNKLGETLGN